MCGEPDAEPCPNQSEERDDHVPLIAISGDGARGRGHGDDDR